MFAENDRISVRQLQCILMLNVLSFGFFVYPSVFYGFSGEEIIASSLISGFVMLLVSKAAMYVCSGNGKGLQHIFDRYVRGKTGLILRIIFLIYLILKASAIAYMYSITIKNNNLPKTPLIAIIAAGLAVSIYLSAKGIETIGRAAEVFIILVLAGILFVFVFAAKSGSFSNITTTQGAGISQIIIRSIKGLYFFQGMEILFVLYMFLGDKCALEPKDISRSFELAWIIMTFSAFLIFTKLKAVEPDLASWPFIKVADNIEIPFAFIERQDFIIISLITIFMVFGVSLNIFSAGVILSDIAKQYVLRIKYIYFALAGTIADLIVRGLSGVYWIYALETVTAVFCFMVLPILLAALKKLKGGVK